VRLALVIRHVACEDLGNLAQVLEQRGLVLRYVEAGLDDLAQLNPLGPEVLIVLGGPIGVYQEHSYPFLTDELRLLERRLAADRPTLGICLGAQLMARALGAKVYAGPHKEIGWAPLQLSEGGQQSCVAQLAKRQAAVLHWHGDTFDLPAGATHLALTPAYDNQAFAWGRRGLALQFHAEVTARGLERWFTSHAHEIEHTPGVSVAQLRRDTQCYAPRLQARAAYCWQTWLNQVIQLRAVPGNPIALTAPLVELSDGDASSPVSVSATGIRGAIGTEHEVTERRLLDTRLRTGDYRYGFPLDGALLESGSEEGGESG
jgi:GMP synthase (glutamine-hydrolysing)